MSLRRLAWLLLCGLSAANASTLRAQTAGWSDAGLTDLSSVVAIGRVAGITSGGDPYTTGIYTYVTIDVTDVLKGPIPPGRVIVKELGGVAGDLELFVFDQAAWTPGEEALLFLDVRPSDRTLRTAAGLQGKWTITTDLGTGERVAAWQEGPSRGLSELTGEIRARAAASAAQVGSINIAPPEALVGGVALPFRNINPSSPVRRREWDTGATIPVDVDITGQAEIGQPASRDAVASAFARINRALFRVPGSDNASLTSGHEDGAPVVELFQLRDLPSRRCVLPFMPVLRGTEQVGFNDPCLEVPAGKIAIGYTFSGATPTHQVDQIPYREIEYAGVMVGADRFGVFGSNAIGGVINIITRGGNNGLGLGTSHDPNSIQNAATESNPLAVPTGAYGSDDLFALNKFYPRSLRFGDTFERNVRPAQVRNVRFVQRGITASFDWTAATGADGYEAEFGTTPGGNNVGSFFLGNKIEFSANVAGVLPGTYYGTFYGVNPVGTGPGSDPVQVVIGSGGGCPAAPPGTPTGLDASVTADLFGRASWTPEPCATSYVLRVTVLSDSLQPVFSFDIPVGSATFVEDDVTLFLGAHLEIRVAAENEHGLSPFSNPVFVHVVPGPPASRQR